MQGSCVYADVYTTINGSQFLFNNSIASGSSNISGGAIYLDGSSGSLAIKNSVFRGNYVSNSSDNSLARSGAISFNSSGLLHVTDSLFADNTAGKGGAIYLGANQSILLTATKSMEYSGNNAENGGFLYMDTATQININVEKGATLTIGNNDSANSGTLDSFESADASAEIFKDKDGSLVVNGSMAQFKGRLYVQNGTMNVNNGFGAPYIYRNTRRRLNHHGKAEHKTRQRYARKRENFQQCQRVACVAPRNTDFEPHILVLRYEQAQFGG